MQRRYKFDIYGGGNRGSGDFSVFCLQKKRESRIDLVRDGHIFIWRFLNYIRIISRQAISRKPSNNWSEE